MFKETHPILGTRDVQRAIASTRSGSDLSWPLEIKPIHRTTSGFAVTPSNSTCSFSSSMRWGQSACGFWWTIQTHSSTSTVNGALSAIPTAFTILRGGRANLLYDLDGNALTFYRDLTSAEKERRMAERSQKHGASGT
jgi:hypothetical protein